LNGVQEVTGSSPVAPINYKAVQMSEEKRRDVRIKTTLFVQYCFDINSVPQKWDITSAKDLSESGVSLVTGKAFEIGATIALRFKIPSRPFDKTEIDAIVVGCQSIGQGSTNIVRAHFKNISDEKKEALREYVLFMVKNQPPT
jgi:hypothetical protein